MVSSFLSWVTLNFTFSFAILKRSSEAVSVKFGLLATHSSHFFFLEDGLCDNAEPAAVFEALLVRPSRRTFEAALAAFALVTFLDFIILPPPSVDECDLAAHSIIRSLCLPELALSL